MKRTLERELKVREIVGVEAHVPAHGSGGGGGGGQHGDRL
jgi:hypothetical protein